MSVTVVQQTSGAEVGRALSAAGNDFADFMRKQKQLQIDQQLAESRLRESALQQQLMQQDLLAKQQAVSEMTSPQEIQRRERMKALDEETAQSNLEGNQNRNKLLGLQSDSQEFENRELNPLKLQHAKTQAALQEIDFKRAQKNFDELGDFWANDKAMRAAVTAGAKAEAEMKGMHRDAYLLAKPELEAATKAQFEQQKLEFTQKQQMLTQAATEFDLKQRAHKADVVEAAVRAAANSRDPEAFSKIADYLDMPELKGMTVTPREYTRGQLDPEKQMMAQAWKDAQSGDPNAQAIVRESLLKRLGHKPESPSDAVMKGFAKKANMDVPEDNLRETTQKYVESMMQKGLKDPKDKTIPSLFGISDDVEGQQMPDFRQVGGVQKIGNGQANPTQPIQMQPTPTSPVPSAKSVSGEYKLAPKNRGQVEKFIQDLDRIDYHISQHDEESRVTYNTNNVEGAKGKEFIDKNPLSTDIREAYTNPFGQPGEKVTRQRDRDKVSIFDGKSQEIKDVRPPEQDIKAYESIFGDKDTEASAGQQARFSALVRQLAKISTIDSISKDEEGGKNFQKMRGGLANVKGVDQSEIMNDGGDPSEVVQLFEQRYGSDGLTKKQWNQVFQLARHFGWR